jgi:uncharacterized protein with NRDE domain
MCTVTFLAKNQHVYITSNRDEHPSRRAQGLTSIDDKGQHKVYFPLDETSGGSWISLADSGRAVCLLNGAFESFVQDPPYRISRGEIVIAAATADHMNEFIENVNLYRVAPFTLVMYEADSLQQLVWDGTKKHMESLSVDTPHIWSSATLYPAHVRAWRKSLFEKWLSDHPDFDRESIIAFHQMANGDPDNGFVMNREEIVKTLSITSIQLKPDAAAMLHLALDEPSREEILIRYDR